jgi:hypothetical protein
MPRGTSISEGEPSFGKASGTAANLLGIES